MLCHGQEMPKRASLHFRTKLSKMYIFSITRDLIINDAILTIKSMIQNEKRNLLI